MQFTTTCCQNAKIPHDFSLPSDRNGFAADFNSPEPSRLLYFDSIDTRNPLQIGQKRKGDDSIIPATQIPPKPPHRPSENVPGGHGQV